MKSEVNKLLWQMCTVLAHKVDGGSKGASFLVLDNNSHHATFKFFTHVNHDRGGIPHTGKEPSRSESMAGQALDENRCIVVRDCTLPDKKVKWDDIHKPHPPQFRGRAVAPVKPLVNGQPKDVGVLCLDIVPPAELSKEDQQIMMLIADKVGKLWLLCGS